MIAMIEKLFSFSGPDVNFKDLKQKGALIVDVRTVIEFNSGHLADSINIPLDTLGKQLPMLRKMNKPVIAVCSSGNRSNIAVTDLKSAGIDAYNGGPWDILKDKIS
jgi:phage shock protein E